VFENILIIHTKLKFKLTKKKKKKKKTRLLFFNKIRRFGI